jgi:hypothetical protein
MAKDWKKAYLAAKTAEETAIKNKVEAVQQLYTELLAGVGVKLEEECIFINGDKKSEGILRLDGESLRFYKKTNSGEISGKYLIIKVGSPPDFAFTDSYKIECK